MSLLLKDFLVFSKVHHLLIGSHACLSVCMSVYKGVWTCSIFSACNPYKRALGLRLKVLLVSVFVLFLKVAQVRLTAGVDLPCCLPNDHALQEIAGKMLHEQAGLFTQQYLFTKANLF